MNVHDFEDKTLGKVVPYGVYDVAANEGWVSVGIDSRHGRVRGRVDPPLVDAMGRQRYPKATELPITADCGGSNGTRFGCGRSSCRSFADETGLTIDVRHFPPGTSQWNKIEHRMFCHITQNWRGRPLDDHRDGRRADRRDDDRRPASRSKCALDPRTYEKGVKVTDAEMRLPQSSSATRSIPSGTIPSVQAQQRSGYCPMSAMKIASGRMRGHACWALGSRVTR